MRKTLLTVALVILAVLTAYFFIRTNAEENELTIIVGNTTIEIEIAETSEQRIKGLSGRKSLPDNRGLLFIYDQPAFYEIWMKDMNFPIDIIWFDSDKKIVSISENVKPESFPEVFLPNDLALYVLEVNAGFSDENRIKIGDKFDYLKAE